MVNPQSFGGTMNDAEHLDFRLLKYVVAVAEEGTFTAAAVRLHLSQSALSTQIRALEHNLGVKIFDRERGTTLTPEGKVLVRYGREGLRIRDHIVQTIQAIHAGQMTPLRLAFTPFVLNPLLKRVSDLYRELIPDSEIYPETEDTEQAILRVQEGDYDAALVTLPVNEQGLEIEILEREPLVVCMRTDDALAKHDAVPAEALDNRISIFTYQRQHPLAYERLIKMFEEVGVTPRPCKPTTNIEHVQWMVKEGSCYALIRGGRPLMPGLTTRPISEGDWTIDTVITCRLKHCNPALALLIEELVRRRRIVSASLDTRSVVPTATRSGGDRLSKQQRQSQMALFGDKTTR